MLGLAASGLAQAATASNAQSPLGTNLQGVSYFSPEQPFLNVLKGNYGWITQNSSTYDTGEEADLQRDSDGYPTSLVANPTPSGGQKFTYVMLIMNSSLPTPAGATTPYPAGQYTVTYTGAGTLQFKMDATVVSSSPGQYIINVTPTSNGIWMAITQTDPLGVGNYIRGISVVLSSQQAAYAGGQIFNPTFLSRIQNFHALRFMDWLSTNGNTLSSWANRPLQSNAFWGTANGVPIETAVQAANAISADAWLNIPVMADNNYITQMATLVHSMLGSSQKAYVEFSNEVWNGSFSQYTYAANQGQATFAGGLGSANDYNRNWYGMRVAQICDIWNSVWGADANRLVCVLGAQAGNTYSATEALSCPFWTSGAPCSGHGISAVAIAPYFGNPVPSAWTSQPDGGLTYLFASLTSQNDPSIPAGGWLGQASTEQTVYPAALASYKLPLIAYEGGQTFTSSGTTSALTTLYIAANRDTRMGNAYTTYLQQWKANGGQLFMLFNDISTYTQWGEWGALESVMQTVSPLNSAPPKWQAIQNFITGNACWWAGCAGTVGSTTTTLTPMAPSNLTVQ